MIVWKFAVYLGVITLLYALIVSVVVVARYGRSRQSGEMDSNISHSGEMKHTASG